MNVDQAKYSSRSFYLAYERCMEQRLLSVQQVQVLLIPGVVCAALSVELGFKALVLADQSAATGHRLDELFAILPARTQDAIVRDIGVNRSQFEKSLELVANAFVAWRYLYEKTSNVHLDLEFLSRLAHATQQVVDVHPDP